jgi:hypothetical protein
VLYSAGIAKLVWGVYVSMGKEVVTVFGIKLPFAPERSENEGDK